MIRTSINQLYMIMIASTLCLSACAKDIFLWDIHEVMVTRDVKQAFNIAWQFNNKRALFQQCTNNLIKNSFSFLWRYITDATVVEELIEAAEREHNQYLVDFIIEIANAYKPIHGTWEIIKELHDVGYTQHIGSNISEQPFQTMIDPKRNPQLAPIFTYFDLSHPQIVNLRPNEPRIIKKPSREFFEEYLQKNNIDLKKNRVIFIDDNKNNIISAASCGFIAILFNNPEQLRHDLRKLGINIAEKPVPLFGINKA